MNEKADPKLMSLVARALVSSPFSSTKEICDALYGPRLSKNKICRQMGELEGREFIRRSGKGWVFVGKNTGPDITKNVAARFPDDFLLKDEQEVLSAMRKFQLGEKGNKKGISDRRVYKMFKGTYSKEQINQILGHLYERNYILENFGKNENDREKMIDRYWPLAAHNGAGYSKSVNDYKIES